jgi:hypothetical protein
MAKRNSKSLNRFSLKNKKSIGNLSVWTLLLLLISWGVTWLALLALPNYSIMIPVIKLPSNFYVTLTLIVSFAAMVFFWRKIPQVAENQNDVSPWVARAFFWFFILLAAYLRLFDSYTAGSSVWDDHYIHTSDIRALIDFQWRPFLFPSGQREPLFPYFTAFLWLFSPTTPGLVIMQISNALIDLIALWMFFLLGKEMVGRRLGLLFMGIGSISKIMIETTKDQVGVDTCVIGGAVALLFTLRFMKKTDFKHAIEWGLALGFGAYTYVPMRPWMPVLLGLVWLWIFSDKKEKYFELYRIILGPGLLLAWAFLFVYKNGFMSAGPLVNFITNPLVCVLCILILGYGYIQGFLIEKKKRFSKLFKWAIAAFVIAVVLLPLYLEPNYAAHVAGISIFSPSFSPNHAASMGSFWNNLYAVLPLFFGPTGFVMCFPGGGDSMYGFFEAALGLLGLAYFVARPSLEKFFIFILFWVGWVPGVLSNAPYPLRYMTCDTTIFLTGAWGLNRLWQAVLQVKNTKLSNALFAVIVLACGIWQMSINFNLYQQWMANRGPNPLVDDIIKEELPNHRVYLIYFDDNFWTVVQDLLNDGREVYKAENTNPIDLVTGQTGKDLAILVYAQDIENQKKLEKEFPGLTWKKSKLFFTDSQGRDYIYCLEVPFNRLKSNNKELFYVDNVSPWTWCRRYYAQYGMGRGLIRYEDRALHWNDTVPAKGVLDMNRSIRIIGDWNIKVEGSYTFSIHTENVYWFILDGKKIIDLPRYDSTHSRSETVHLKPGIHHVEVVNSCMQFVGVAPLMVKAPGVSQEVPLDDFALSTVPVVNGVTNKNN